MSETVSLDISSLSIKTSVFDGPLELLLELVEKRKLLINDINLAAVTDEYIKTVSTMQEQSIPNTTQFVQLAATLLLIKSKSLLPVLELSQDEEEEIEQLEHRLRLYQIYRDAGKTVQSTFGQKHLFNRRYVANTEPIFVTDQFTSTGGLYQAMYELITTLPTIEKKPKVQVRPIISLEEMINRLHNRVEKAIKTTLRELLAGEQEKKTIIVGFLAILESVKQGTILVAQASCFADIEVEKGGTCLPNYMLQSDEYGS